MAKYETTFILWSDNIEATTHLYERFKEHDGVSFEIVNEFDDPFVGYHVSNIRKARFMKKLSCRTWLGNAVLGKIWDFMISYVYNHEIES